MLLAKCLIHVSRLNSVVYTFAVNKVKNLESVIPVAYCKAISKLYGKYLQNLCNFASFSFCLRTFTHYLVYVTFCIIQFSLFIFSHFI